MTVMTPAQLANLAKGRAAMAAKRGNPPGAAMQSKAAPAKAAPAKAAPIKPAMAMPTMAKAPAAKAVPSGSGMAKNWSSKHGW